MGGFVSAVLTGPGYPFLSPQQEGRDPEGLG